MGVHNRIGSLCTLDNCGEVHDPATVQPEAKPFVDAVSTHSCIDFSLLDRLRILFGRSVHVHTKVRVSAIIERHQTEPAHVYVEHLFPEKPQVWAEGGRKLER